MIAGELNQRSQPRFHLWLCRAVPHLCAPTQRVILNRDLQISIFCPNIMVETHLLSEDTTKLLSCSCWGFFLYAKKRGVLLPGSSEWAGRRDWSGLLWSCFLSQVKGTGNVLTEREKSESVYRWECEVTVVDSKCSAVWPVSVRRVPPDVLLLWSCSSPWTSVVLIHPGSVSELGNRSQNPSSKSHLLYPEPLTENTVH